MSDSPSVRPHGDVDPVRLFESAYEELCRIARRSRFVGPGTGAIQAQAVVNETYIRLRDRFFELPPHRRCEPGDYLLKVALAMRTVARDRWRRARAARRGGPTADLTLDEARTADPKTTGGLSRGDVLSLYEAMDRLQRCHPEWFDVIRHRYFEGCTVRETATRMGIATECVKTYRRQALAWLRRSF